jgi:hypothetical protein
MGDVVLDPSTFAVSNKETKAPTLLKLKKELLLGKKRRAGA